MYVVLLALVAARLSDAQISGTSCDCSTSGSLDSSPPSYASTSLTTSVSQTSCLPCSVPGGSFVAPGTSFQYASSACTNVTVPTDIAGVSNQVLLQVIFNCTCPCTCGCNCTCDGSRSAICYNSSTPSYSFMNTTTFSNATTCNLLANASTVSSAASVSTTATAVVSSSESTTSPSTAFTTTSTASLTTTPCTCSALGGAFPVAPGSSGSSTSCSYNDAIGLNMLFAINFACGCSCGCTCSTSNPYFVGICAAGTPSNFTIYNGNCSAGTSLSRRKRQAEVATTSSSSVCACPTNSSSTRTPSSTESSSGQAEASQLSSSSSLFTITTPFATSTTPTSFVASSSSSVTIASFSTSPASSVPSLNLSTLPNSTVSMSRMTYSVASNVSTTAVPESGVTTNGSNVTVIIIIVVILGVLLVIGIIVLIWYIRNLPHNYPLVEGHPDAKRQIARSESYRKRSPKNGIILLNWNAKFSNPCSPPELNNSV